MRAIISIYENEKYSRDIKTLRKLLTKYNNKKVYLLPEE